MPIIIHLWFQKKLKKIPFSNLQFLKTSEVKRFGWLKFREILILVLRCLFVSFLFLSLARPQLQRNVFRVGRLASVVIIVDNSYSMAYGENFTLAKKMAREMLETDPDLKKEYEEKLADDEEFAARASFLFDQSVADQAVSETW